MSRVQRNYYFGPHKVPKQYRNSESVSIHFLATVLAGYFQTFLTRRGGVRNYEEPTGDEI